MQSIRMYDSLENSDIENLDDSSRLSQTETIIGNAPDCSEDDLIPFYDTNLPKSQIELCVKNSRCSSLNGSMQSRTKLSLHDTSKKKRSYLGMYREKNGIAEKGYMPSTRGTCLDLTPKSLIENSEGNSAYFNSDDSSNTSFVSTNEDLRLSLTSLESKLQSVSEVGSKQKCGKIFQGRSKNVSMTKLPEMGRLGPEIPVDKLDLYKRRQQYGKMVSQTNKINMMERRALRNLKEIKNSKNQL